MKEIGEALCVIAMIVLSAIVADRLAYQDGYRRGWEDASPLPRDAQPASEHPLCKLGIHASDRYRYVSVSKRRGRHRWIRNYCFCRRCGRRLYLMSLRRKGGPHDGR